MSPARYRVAAVEPESSGSRSAVEERAHDLIKEAAKSGARTVCLPEHWLPGRRANIEDSVSAFSATARESGIFLILGADFARHRRAVTVESIVLGPDGDEVGRQRKVHLFRGEKKEATPGSTYEVFELAGVKAGIAICHDLVYPEVARIMTLKGAEVIFAPAKIGIAGLEPWEMYVKTRALENRVPIVSPNCLATPHFPGRGLIVGFTVKEEEGIVYPEVLAGGQEQIVLADLELGGVVERYRQERLSSRRPETYLDLVKRPYSGPVRHGKRRR